MTSRPNNAAALGLLAVLVGCASSNGSALPSDPGTAGTGSSTAGTGSGTSGAAGTGSGTSGAAGTGSGTSGAAGTGSGTSGAAGTGSGTSGAAGTGSGTSGAAGTTSTAGASGSSGAAGAAGTGTSGAAGSAGAAGTGGGATASCGATAVTINSHPFTDCKFAGGAPNNNGNSSYLDFVSAWVGYEKNGGLDANFQNNTACDGCNLAKSVANTGAMAVFYAYFIGYQANLLGGFGDCNVDKTDGHNLCTDGAQWIKTNRDKIINMYAQYAKKVYAASPNKPVIWWLEGDFVQYTYTMQSSPLSYADEGALARDITCAIKSNEPNAVVAMNHSPWIANAVADAFWTAMPTDVLDMVWVQGYGDTGTLPNSFDTDATYSWLHTKTGRTVMAETSFAGAGANDRWTTASATAINARIASSVIGVLVSNPAGSYQSSINTLNPQLSATCN